MFVQPGRRLALRACPAGRGRHCLAERDCSLLGFAGLDLAEQGLPATVVIERLRARAGPAESFRQLPLIDTQGDAAVFSGQCTLGRHGHHIEEGAAAAGNMLASDDVPYGSTFEAAGRLAGL